MIIEEFDEKKSELPIITELKRIRITYRIYKYIDIKGKCVINDIKKDIGANLKTVYRVVRYLTKWGFIEKSFTAHKEKDKGYFFILTTPALKIELKRIKSMIADF